MPAPDPAAMNDRGPHLRLTAPPASRPLRHPPRPCLREGGGSALPVRRRRSLSTRFRSRRSAAAAAAASEAKARQRAPCAGVCVCARARARALVLGGLKGSACGAGSLRGPPQPASALQGDSEGWPAVGLGWAPPPGRGSASVPELGGATLGGGGAEAARRALVRLGKRPAWAATTWRGPGTARCVMPLQAGGGGLRV